jgi:hypothetical protein
MPEFFSVALDHVSSDAGAIAVVALAVVALAILCARAVPRLSSFDFRVSFRKVDDAKRKPRRRT